MIQIFRLTNLYFLIIVLCFFENSVGYPKKRNLKSETLQLVHVMFRHGDRTPGRGELYDSNPFLNESYYKPYGYGQLTNDGKRTMYNVGSALRTRYDSFLGDTWNINILDARSTDYNRTKMSASYMLAGLWPPRGCLKWKSTLSWQSIPYNYFELSKDKELSSWACPTVLPILATDKDVVERLSTYDYIMDILSENTGLNVSYVDALSLYFGMFVQERLGYKLEEWTKQIYPEPLKSYVIDFYYIETSTTELKRIIAGYFLKKVLLDTELKLNGSLTPPDRKMFLYSAHETNIATLLTSLNYNLTEIPTYGSYIIFEVHKINDVYGIKLFYQDYTTDEPQSFTLSGCEEFCPLDSFKQLIDDTLPRSDLECYGES